MTRLVRLEDGVQAQKAAEPGKQSAGLRTQGPGPVPKEGQWNPCYTVKGKGDRKPEPMDAADMGTAAEATQGAAPDPDRLKLEGLFSFAEGMLMARERVQMTMNGSLGVFREEQVIGLPGVELSTADGAWLRIARLRETRPPEPESHVADFLSTLGGDPNKPPRLAPTITVEVLIEEASDLEEAGLLRSENVHPVVEDGREVFERVRITLLAEDCEEVEAEFNRYVSGSWAEWARTETPVRKSVLLYRNLFKMHAAIHTAEATPPEIVWGLGIGRWAHPAGKVDMPIIEQQIDIEIENGGAITLRPRELAPTLSLRSYFELGIPNMVELQENLRTSFAQMLDNNVEVSPFTTTWEPMVSAATAHLDAAGRHATREEIDHGTASTEPPGEALRFASTWAIFGRPRSVQARLQDLRSLREEIAGEAKDLPNALRRFVSLPPEPCQKAISGRDLDPTISCGRPEPTVSEIPMPKGVSDERSFMEKGSTEKEGMRRVHFFPLPFNEEQGQVVDMLEDPDTNVVTVSGPPGTGKTHSIANIVSHMMACGRRVLVTARTAEAIAAVREKLPESLRPLVIASTGTDRESNRQLQSAIDALSSEVVHLDTSGAGLRMESLEVEIIDCDRAAAKADRALDSIARANLDTLEWQGKHLSPMALQKALNHFAEAYAWFTDRPTRPAPAGFHDLLARLAAELPQLAPDLPYAGVDLPEPDALPTTADLVLAYEKETARVAIPVDNCTDVPPMARDTASAEMEAKRVAEEIEALGALLDGFDEGQAQLVRGLLSDTSEVLRRHVEMLRGELRDHGNTDRIARVRFDMRDSAPEAFRAAALRGAAGRLPVPFGLFKGALKQAVATVSLDGRAPSGAEDWQAVHDACKLKTARADLEARVERFASPGFVARVPHHPWEVAEWIATTEGRLGTALDIADRLAESDRALRTLFPCDLDHRRLCDSLDLEPALRALRGNLSNSYVPPLALADLDRLAGTDPRPVFEAVRTLRAALCAPETDPATLVRMRGDLTREIGRLHRLKDALDRIDQDLDSLNEAGAPDWAARLRANPHEAARLVPDDWQAAWDWAVAKGEVEVIVALGNGDAQRKVKSDALDRRRRCLEELIRIRTLLGLRARMSPSVKAAMQAFTEAVSRIGKGTGASAPRFRKAAQNAARGAAPAAPVWIMPEYKVAEQMPANIGDFDLVILDEASQSDTTALGPLARGKKVLIVGDEQQVSPAPVGIPDQKIKALRMEFLSGLPNAELVDQNTSIFAISQRTSPDTHLMLREHFRCVAPIIQFSMRFYQNRLIPLRIPTESERLDPPLVDIFLPGATRQGKVNKSEVDWIVDEIAALVADPGFEMRDIGVISFIGTEQADRIGRMLMEDRRVGPEKIEKHRIIVGDARAMQGQERSIVFLSMVATPETLRVQNSKSDLQRANVAMSRAADRLYLVRSVTLEDLNPKDIKTQILRHFADPIPAGHGFMPREADLRDRSDSDFEREVLDLLLAANYRVTPQVPVGDYRIDLVVEGAKDRRLAIELEGDKYHAPDVWARNMACQAALERAGWTFWRLFGTQWVTAKQQWWADLVAALGRLGIEPIGSMSRGDCLAEQRIFGAEYQEPTGVSRKSSNQPKQ